MGNWGAKVPSGSCVSISICINSHYIGRHTKEMGADGSLVDVPLGSKDLFKQCAIFSGLSLCSLSPIQKGSTL